MGTTGTEQGQWLGYRPALDGLRAIAVVQVIAAHLGAPGQTHRGYIGVAIFLAMSGFLITTLLLEERQRDGTVSFPSFYRRRAVRLLPALGLMLSVTWAFGVVSGGQLAAAIAYMANVVRASGGQMGVLAHTWTLSLEEQFYAVWPLVLVVVLARRRQPLTYIIVGAITASLTRFVLGGALDEVWSRWDALLAGCAVAIVRRHGGWDAARRWLFPAALIALAWPMLTTDPEGSTRAWAITSASYGAAALVAWAVATQPVWLTGRTLVWAGRRSYGWYLWQNPAIYAFSGAVAPTVLVTVAAAEFSWWAVERPAQRLRDRREGRQWRWHAEAPS